MKNYFSIHNHTDMSNIRLLDSTNKLDKLVNYAIELGLPGLCITDHECLAQSMAICDLQKKLAEEDINFKIGIGNEVYLIDKRSTEKQDYYHLILIAKDETGHRQLRELSSRAWYNSYTSGKMVRVPILKSELEEIILKEPGHLICTTACRGSELGISTIGLIYSQVNGEGTMSTYYHNKIVDYMLFLKNLFGEDFYIECQPNKNDVEQNLINKRYVGIAQAFGVKMVYSTDSHYLKAEDRFIHKAFLTSKEGEREVDDFYKTTYMMSQEEIYNQFEDCFTKEQIEEMTNNTLEIMDKISIYDLHKKQNIVKVEMPKVELSQRYIDKEKYPTLYELYYSDEPQEKYWIDACLKKLIDINKYNEEYLERLEIEADVIKFIGEDFGMVLFAYFNNMSHYIDYIWEVGSVVGPSRGSACCYLSNYLLGITQIDPIEAKLDCWWRFLNKGNVGSVITTDIDIDCDPLARNAFINKMKEELVDTNCLAVGAFGTITAKSAIGVAGRGYRSEDCPNGLDPDEIKYLSSLVPVERGFLWSIEDVVYGNEEKDREPVPLFVREIDKYPGLLEIILGVQGLIDKVTRHAAGVVMAENMLDYCSIMRTPSEELITCYSLYPLEDAGLVKIDVLVTDACSKITACLKSLQKYGFIEKELSLKDAYNKYIHPEVIDENNQDIWDRINSNTVSDLFQFCTGVGLDAIKKIQPQNIVELANTNAALRLVSEQGAETPVDRFVRLKNNINLWYEEMTKRGLTKEEIKMLEPYYLPYSGCIFLQESLMMILMNICGFSLSDANKGRKVVSKKNVKQIPWLKEKIFNAIEHKAFAQYVWDTAIKPQLSYAFSLPHCLGYGWVAMQEAYLTLKFPQIFWDTACLNINASTIDEVEYNFDMDNIYTDKNFIRQEKKKKVQGVKYDKIAIAIGNMKNFKVIPPDINLADKEFVPDYKNDRIIYGLKSINGVGDNDILEIFNGRPFSSLDNFLEKTHLTKTTVISLIKAGAFDSLHKDWTREKILYFYLEKITPKKKQLTIANFASLIEYGFVPEKLNHQIDIYNFNTILKTYKNGDYYYFGKESLSVFYNMFFDENNITLINGLECINQKTWDKIYKKEMDIVRDWLKESKESLLTKLNSIALSDTINKYGTGTISTWEMDTLGYYSHQHELINVDYDKYGISEYKDLNEFGTISSWFDRGKARVPLYRIDKIIGTVVGKNDIRHTISLLTPKSGVVSVKFNKEYYALLNRQLSEVQEDGKKKITDKSWFQKGTTLLINGYRMGDNFRAKVYRKAGVEQHTVYKIECKNYSNEIKLISR